MENDPVLLFDSGSNASFVADSCVQRLGLLRSSSIAFITQIGSTQGSKSKGVTPISRSPYYSGECNIIRALIYSNTTSELPMHVLAVSSWCHINDLRLADSQFMMTEHIKFNRKGDTYMTDESVRNYFV